MQFIRPLCDHRIYRYQVTLKEEFLLVLISKKLLARSNSTTSEPFQRTDISIQSLRPTNYTSSNTERYNIHYAKSALPNKAQASSRAAVMEILAM